MVPVGKTCTELAGTMGLRALFCDPIVTSNVLRHWDSGHENGAMPGYPLQ